MSAYFKVRSHLSGGTEIDHGNHSWYGHFPGNVPPEYKVMLTDNFKLGRTFVNKCGYFVSLFF
jgi:hypothetical protein